MNKKKQNIVKTFSFLNINVIFTLVFFVLFLIGPCVIFSQNISTENLTLEDYLLSRNASGNTLNEVLVSVGLYEKTNTELLDFLGIDIEKQLDKTELISNRWENSNLLCVASATKDDGLSRYFISLESGKLERFSKNTSLKTESFRNIKRKDLEPLMISEDKVLSTIEKLFELSEINKSINPEKLELDNRFQSLGMSISTHWRYFDVPEYYGIPSRSSVSIRIHALTGEILGYTLYNMHIPAPEEVQPIITKDEAFVIAANWAREKNLSVKTDSENLIYAPKSNIWSADRSNDLFMQENKFRLCWNIDIASETGFEGLVGSVDIDALTGEIVGGLDARITR